MVVHWSRSRGKCSSSSSASTMLWESRKAVPNELEDDDTGEQVRLQEKDPRFSHLENQDEN
jgi:hypothetical protein